MKLLSESNLPLLADPHPLILIALLVPLRKSLVVVTNLNNLSVLQIAQCLKVSTALTEDPSLAPQAAHKSL